MKILGIVIIREQALEDMKQKAHRDAVANIIEVLRKKDSIYLEPVTMEQTSSITNCAFFGNPINLVGKLGNTGPTDETIKEETHVKS